MSRTKVLLKLLVRDFTSDNRRKLKLDYTEQSLLIDLTEEYLSQVDDMIEVACEDDILLDDEEKLLEMTDLIYRRKEAAERIHKELIKYDLRYHR